jgi:LmbE family N-acetylglucosaminyl deacetylase
LVLLLECSEGNKFEERKSRKEEVGVTRKEELERCRFL